MIRKRRTKLRPGRLRGADMEALRREVFERDGYQCQHMKVIGIDWKLGKLYRMCRALVTWETGHLAHIISRGRGGKDEASNLLTKCPHCHIVKEHHEGNGGKIVPART